MTAVVSAIVVSAGLVMSLVYFLNKDWKTAIFLLLAEIVVLLYYIGVSIKGLKK